ncbi:MAG TPA: hypothetical protein VFF06_36445 [Polyangia bacterium]|nr:hypothetical protein [Polyangia bacterium]
MKYGWVVVLAIAGGGFGAWKLYQRKVLGDGRARLECSLRLETSQADCYATFLSYPPGDTTDVRVELDGKTLSQPAAFDWAFLAPLDAREGPALTAGEPPPLGRQLRWRMPMSLVAELTPDVGDFIVHAKLFWAGRQQDLARFSTKVFYAPKGAR